MLSDSVGVMLNEETNLKVIFLKSWIVDRAMRSDPTQPLESIFGSDIPFGQALDIDDVIKLTSGSLSKSLKTWKKI